MTDNIWPNEGVIQMPSDDPREKIFEAGGPAYALKIWHPDGKAWITILWDGIVVRGRDE